MGKGVGGIWHELKRRRVVSTAAAYSAVSFVALQLAEILFPAFNLGAGAVRALLAAELAFFPIVLAVSWVFDVTRDGFVRTDEPGGTIAPSRVLIGGVLGSAAALALLGWFGVQSFDPNAAPVIEDASIAVLPFADMSASGDQAFLGDGLAEEILNILAGVDGLKVAARTSSFSFREENDIREIGNRLGVATILEGSVRRSNEAVRITAQLIDANSGFHLWSQTYDRELDDLFAVQDEIARSIAGALLGELDLQGTAPRYAVSQAAQEAYWKGRAQWNRRYGGGIPQAIRYFNEAIEIDSLYAQAYAGLADSWALMPQFVAAVDPVEAIARAEGLARRAIAIDDGFAEPHASLGLVRALRGERVDALASFSRAIELNPSYAPALHWRANVLAEMGRLAEAESDARRAAEVDPLSAAIAADLGNILLWRGDLAGAGVEFARAQSIQFGFAPAAFGAAMVAVAEGEAIPAQMALTQWAAVSQLPSALGARLVRGMIEYRTSGASQPVPSEVDVLAEAGTLSGGTTAALHALHGDLAGAITWVARAIDDGSWVDQYFAVNPIYDPLRDLPEFQEALERLGG